MFTKYRNLILVIPAVSVALAAAIFLSEVGPSAHAQSSSPTSPSTPDPPMDPDRQQAWNSPEMLRARAWLADYSKNTASLGADEIKKQTATLSSMTPEQMKLFALRHEHEYQQQKKQAASIQKLHETALQQAQAAAEAQKWWYQNVHKSELQQAESVDKATQQSYNAISSEENASANLAQSEINAGNAEEAAAGQERMSEMNSFNPGLGGYGGGYGYPAAANYHYHFHVYPSAP